MFHPLFSGPCDWHLSPAPLQHSLVPLPWTAFHPTPVAFWWPSWAKKIKIKILLCTFSASDSVMVPCSFQEIVTPQAIFLVSPHLLPIFHIHWTIFHPLAGRCMCSRLCPALCDPMDCSPSGSSVHGIFQAIPWNGSGLPFPSPVNLLDPGMEPTSAALIGGFFTTLPPGKLSHALNLPQLTTDSCLEWLLPSLIWQTPIHTSKLSSHVTTQMKVFTDTPTEFIFFRLLLAWNCTISIPLSQASSQSFFTQFSFIMAQTADQALTLTSGLFSSFLYNLRKVGSHLQLSPCGGIHCLVSCYRNISTSLWPLSALGPFHLRIHLFPRKQTLGMTSSFRGNPPSHRPSLGNFPIIEPLCPEMCPIESMEFFRPEYWSG